MKFKFVPNYTIESEDPEVFVLIAGTVRDSGHMFVLNMHGKQIGFATAKTVYDEIIRKNDEGTTEWHIGLLGCSIDTTRRRGKSLLSADNLNVSEYRFENQKEIQKATEYIVGALRTYSSRVDFEKGSILNPVFHEDQGDVDVILTPDLLKKIKSGELLK